jgi:5-(carboxyamino)imidazole ribonucleotide mutase
LTNPLQFYSTLAQDKNMSEAKPLVGVIMGSNSDWPTLSQAAEILNDFGVPYEAKVVSAHRTPDKMRKRAA